tara:strand:- start:1523 stop:1726 length:204 start_codon:yes stop_codon:yes gene_type:complete
MKRSYNTIKWILRDNIKKNVRSLWTYENDNFTMIYDNYDGEARIYTASQMLKLIDKIIKKETDADTE